MQVTIVGLPGSGKTTVFNALTGGHAETGGFSGSRAAPNVSVVKVPDERVDRLSALFNPKKTTYADVTYVDVAIPAGAAREGTINPDVLALVRNADALLHVARAFDDAAVAVPADPWRDVDELDLEFTVADLSVIEKRLEKLTTQGRHGSQAERDQAQREEELLRRIEPHLSDGRPIRSFGLTDDEELLLRGYRFLTQKPVLVVLNIDEGRLPEAAHAGSRRVAIGTGSHRPMSRRWPGRSRRSWGSSARTTPGSSWTTSGSPSPRAAGSSG